MTTFVNETDRANYCLMLLLTLLDLVDGKRWNEASNYAAEIRASVPLLPAPGEPVH